MGQVFVKSLGRTIATPCSGEQTVKDLKRKIQDVEAIPEHEQRLLFAGKQLEDGQSLHECSIEDHSTLHLVMGLRAGRGDSLLALRLCRTDSTMLGVGIEGQVTVVEAPRAAQRRRKILKRAHSLAMRVRRDGCRSEEQTVTMTTHVSDQHVWC